MRPTLKRHECRKLKKLKLYFWCGEKAKVIADFSAQSVDTSSVIPYVYKANTGKEIKNKIRKYRTFKPPGDLAILYVEKEQLIFFGQVPSGVQIILI